MDITFGCIITNENMILLVRERNNALKRLERWNFLSGKGYENEFIFNNAIIREIKEESSLTVTIKGIVAIYESITPKKHSYYFVIGCHAKTTKISIEDKEVLEAKWFSIDEFMNWDNGKIVHSDMKICLEKYLAGKYINQIRKVQYTK